MAKPLPEISYWIMLRLFSHWRRDGRSGCWLWTGFTRNGYGVVKSTMNMGYVTNVILAHRLSYHWFVGALNDLPPKAFGVDHMCRNKACFNPLHLELVTTSENCKRRSLSRRKHRALIRTVATRTAGGTQ